MTGTTPISLTIPDRVSATFVVAAPERPPGTALAAIAERLTSLPRPSAPRRRRRAGREPMGRASTGRERSGRELTGGPVEVAVDEVGSEDPVLAWAREILCCPECSLGEERLLGDLLARSRRHYAVTCTAPAGWPPVHLWAAARAVDELAEATGGVRLDPGVPRLLPSPWRPPPVTRPRAFAVGDWLWPRLGLGDDGRHMLLTAGLARFGLPELGAEGLAAREVHPTIHLLEDLAQALTRRLFAHVASTGLPAPLTLPPRLPILATAATWRRHCRSAPQECGTGRRTVRLRHDRLPRGRGDRLIVLPDETVSPQKPISS